MDTVGTGNADEAADSDATEADAGEWGSVVLPTVGVRHVRSNLEVSDVDEAVAFFDAVFGWTPLVNETTPVAFAIVGAGTPVVAVVRINEPAVSEITALYVEVDDLSVVLERVDAAGLVLAQPPTEHPWGLRDVVVVGPDGHLIAVGEAVAQPAAGRGDDTL